MLRLGEKQSAVRLISSPRSPTDPFEMEDYYQDVFAALFEVLEGQPHIFAADYEAVVRAAREAVHEEGFSLREDQPVNDSTQVILCEKYGRFLRVAVQRLGERQTAVRVIFRRGEGVEVWRFEDDSQDILAALIERLEGQPQRSEAPERRHSLIRACQNPIFEHNRVPLIAHTSGRGPCLARCLARQG